MDPDLPDNGFLPALLKEGLDSQKSRALATAEQGKAVLLLGAYKTKDREKKFAFSDEIALESDSLFALKERNLQLVYSKLEDLGPYTIGVVRGAVHGSVFDEAGYLHKEEAESNYRNLSKLLAKRVDFIAGPKNIVLATLKKYFPRDADKIIYLEPALQQNSLYIAVSRKYPNYEKLVKDINTALDTLKKNGTYAKLRKVFLLE